MSEIVIVTTPERLEAVKAELETAWVGGSRGLLLLAFLRDCERAQRIEPEAAQEQPCPAE